MPLHCLILSRAWNTEWTSWAVPGEMYIETSSPLNNGKLWCAEDWPNSMLQNTCYTKFKVVGSFTLPSEGPAWQRDVRVLWGVTLLSDTVKEERSTIWRCLMKGDLASEVELLADVMKEKLSGMVLKSSPQYMKSLNDSSINGRGNHVRVQKSVWKASVLQKTFSLLKHGQKNITMKKYTKCLEKCEKKLFFSSFCYSSNSVTWM